MRRTELRRPPQGLKAGSLKRKTAMARGSTPSGSASGLRRRQPRRDWKDAREKVDREGVCRLCGSLQVLQAAHVTAREADAYPEWILHAGSFKQWHVHPDRIVPLCGGDFGCHGKYDRHEVDLLGALNLWEELQAVMDLRGIENARVRTAPSQYRSTP